VEGKGLVFSVILVLAFLIFASCCITYPAAKDTTPNKSTDALIPNPTVISYFLPAGNASNISAEIPVLSSNQTVLSDEAGKQKLAAIAPIQSYKFNMTEWQKKLDTDLLYIIDPAFPEMGNSRDEVKKRMSENGQLLYADEAIKKFNLQNRSEHPVGDHALIYITINSSAPDQNIDPYITKIMKKRDNMVTAWVDLNNLKQLASLKAVQNIHEVIPADFGYIPVENSSG
jgi:hypothetical protein